MGPITIKSTLKLFEDVQRGGVSSTDKSEIDRVFAEPKKSCIIEKNLVTCLWRSIEMKTTVTARGQTVIPAKIRKEHQIGISAKLEWIDDGK